MHYRDIRQIPQPLEIARVDRGGNLQQGAEERTISRNALGGSGSRQNIAELARS